MKIAHGPPASHERRDRLLLCFVGALIDEDDGPSTALMDRTGPVGEDGEVEIVECRGPVPARVDVPRPAALALACRRTAIDVAGTAVVTVTRDHQRALDSPSLARHFRSPRRD